MDDEFPILEDRIDDLGPVIRVVPLLQNPSPEI
jgi:hypothetical protein